MKSIVAPQSNTLIKLDLGCGTRKKDGFVGVDSRKFPGVDVVADLRKRWPWGDWSVGEVYCSHFVEHLDADERIHFVNELYRVMAPGAKARLITPHWASHRAYGDLTHKWPPVSEFWYPYLHKHWRQDNAPHNDFYTCDFDHTIEFGITELLAARPLQEQQFAISNYKEAATDLIAILVRR